MAAQIATMVCLHYKQHQGAAACEGLAPGAPGASKCRLQPGIDAIYAGVGNLTNLRERSQV